MNKPNLLFVLSDQWRKQSIGCLRDDPVHTPNTDRFADESCMFTNALCAYPRCAPARASILTGKYPVTNGVTHNSRTLSDNEATSIAKLLKQQGYATGYIGKWHLDGNDLETQFVPVERRQGFEYWYAYNISHNHYTREYYTDADTHILEYGWQPDHETEVAMEYMSRHRDRPFALFVSYAPPHPGSEQSTGDLKGKPIRKGYIAPEKYEAMYRNLSVLDRPNFRSELDYDTFITSTPHYEISREIPGYFGSITSIDENFGRLLAYLKESGLSENTIVVLHSDHGEMLGSHGRKQKHIWYEEAIGVPFIIRWPGKIKRAKEEALFNQVDIVPSLLGLMGIEIPDEVEGTDCSPLMLGAEMDKPQSALIYFDNVSNDPAGGGDYQLSNWRCLRTDRFSYVVSEKNGVIQKILYDLEQDPHQLAPVRFGGPRDDMMLDLERQLRLWLLKTNDPFVAFVREQLDDDE